MTLETFTFPVGSIRCQRGDDILHRGADGRIRVYRVQELLKLSRLVPFGEGALVEERAILDSERPAFQGEIFLLLGVYEPDFASPEEAARAVAAGSLGSATEGRCLDIRRFPTDTSQVYRSSSPPNR